MYGIFTYIYHKNQPTKMQVNIPYLDTLCFLCQFGNSQKFKPSVPANLKFQPSFGDLLIPNSASFPRQNAVLLKQSDVDGSTPLHLCAKQGHAECVQLLLQ